MDLGQQIFIMSRLILGALAAFLAIMLWSRTRDTPWMLIVIGAIAAYGEVVYSILKHFGILGLEGGLSIGSMPIMSIFLSCLPLIFFCSALAVMVFRKYRRL